MGDINAVLNNISIVYKANSFPDFVHAKENDAMISSWPPTDDAGRRNIYSWLII